MGNHDLQYRPGVGMGGPAGLYFIPTSPDKLHEHAFHFNGISIFLQVMCFTVIMPVASLLSIQGINFETS